jgi:flagellar basal-body rod modification protein FlgD
MTTVTSATSAATTTATTSTAAQTLSSNFQTFLTLLTTQLQNQDPLSPMDSNEFTQQLVMYSQVEQQIDTNSKLDSLISLGTTQTNSYAMSYLGKSVVLTDGQASLSNGEAGWTYGLGSDASTTTLTVTNSSGKVVYTASGETAAGTHDFSWDGTDSSGDQLADGAYTLTVASTASDGSTVKTSVASKGTVTGVDLSGTTPQLVIGSTEVPIANATLITN